MKQEFEELAKLCQRDGSTVEHVVQQLLQRGPLVAAFGFALPFLLPVPLPGLSTVLGLAIAGLGVMSIAGQSGGLPLRLGLGRVPARYMARPFELATSLAAKMEKWVRPRFVAVCSLPVLKLAGLGIVICGLVLALPLPPGTNWPPALGVAALALGSLRKDGLCLALGLLICACNVAALSAITMLGIEGFKGIF